MKTKFSLLSLAVCAAFGASPAFAQTGTINFTGTIQSATCTADISGGGAGSGNVNLGLATPADLAAVGPATSPAAVDIAVQLDASCVGDNFWVYFSGPPAMVNANGRLVTPLDAQGVEVQLLDQSGTQINVSQGGAVPSGLAPVGGQGASWTVAAGVAGITDAYKARFYSAVASNTKQGSIAGTQVQYNVIYH